MSEPIGLVVAAAGFGLLVGVCWLRALNRRARRWPAVRGVVTKSALCDDLLGVGACAEFSYRFAVDDRPFESSRVSFAVAWPSVSALERLVQRLPVGSNVDVRYDPENPGVAVIELASPFSGLLAAAGGAVLVVTALRLF